MEEKKRYKKTLSVLIIVYFVFTAVFFIFDLGGKAYQDQGMGVGNSFASEKLTDKPEYKQYFYCPKITTGLQILIGTDGTEPEGELVFKVYDGETDECLVDQIVDGSEIEDNEYFEIIFDDCELSEGELYYYELYLCPGSKDTVKFWLGSGTSINYGDLYYKDNPLVMQMIVTRIVYKCVGYGMTLWMVLSVISMFVLTDVSLKRHGDNKKQVVINFAIGLIVIILLVIAYSVFIV